MAKDIESRIARIEEILEENNEILHKIRRKEVFNFWFNILKIMIFVGVFYYGYMFLQPILEQMMAVYNSFKETVDTAGEIKQNLNVGIPGVDVGKLIEGLKQN